MKQTPKNSKPVFVVVYGAPRTGTSLTMDIVCAAQYNPGKCYTPPANPRRGRNEHPVFGQSPSVLNHDLVWKQIKNENITCCKIIGYPEWINFLSKRFNIIIVAPCRDKATRKKSAADMLVHIGGGLKGILLQEQLLAKKKVFLNRFKGPIVYVRFDKLISKDPETFKALRDFLGYEGPIEDLMRPVDAGRVKFNGKK